MIETREKETTAHGTSVGADVGQSNQTNCTVSIADRPPEIKNEIDSSADLLEKLKKIQHMSDPSFLPTVTMQELYDNVYQSRPPVIDGLLYTGTYIFAGAPKVGKSFFMAQLAYHISTGQPLWDYEVRQGTVLYLALEDNYRRLQERMFRMYGIEGTEHLYFAVHAKQLGNGLDEQLEHFLKDHPDTRLIIIDTLQKIREMNGEGYSYADDYQIIGNLKKFADKTGVCLLIVHHTRKMPAGDKFDMISGTTGLLGCADGAFLLQKEKRTDSAAVLHIVGRDQPDQCIHLLRDEERLIWTFDHADRELWKEPPDPILESVSALLKEEPEWNGSASELIDRLHLDIQPNALTRKLNVRAGKLFNDYGIRYENSHGRTGSQLKLIRDRL